MLTLYYRIWVDAIKRTKSRPENVENWATGAMIFMSTSMTLNLLLIMSGTYPVAFTYTSGGCVNTLWENIIISPTLALDASATSHCQNTGIPGQISAVSSITVPLSYMWLPDNLYGPSHTVTPVSTTIYTVVVNTSSCIVTKTVAVNVKTDCCTFTNTIFNSVLTSTTSLNGPMAINSSFTVQAGQNLTFANGEF